MKAKTYLRKTSLISARATVLLLNSFLLHHTNVLGYIISLGLHRSWTECATIADRETYPLAVTTNAAGQGCLLLRNAVVYLPGFKQFGQPREQGNLGPHAPKLGGETYFGQPSPVNDEREQDNNVGDGTRHGFDEFIVRYTYATKQPRPPTDFPPLTWCQITTATDRHHAMLLLLLLQGDHGMRGFVCGTVSVWSTMRNERGEGQKHMSLLQHEPPTT